MNKTNRNNKLLEESLNLLKSFLFSKNISIENTGINNTYYSFKPFNYNKCTDFCKNGNGYYNEDYILAKKISYESQFFEFLDYVKQEKNDDALLFICLKKTPSNKSYSFNTELKSILSYLSHNKDILFNFINRTNLLEMAWEEFDYFMPLLSEQQKSEIFKTIFKTKTFTNISSQKLIYQKFIQYISLENQSELIPFFYKIEELPKNNLNQLSFLNNIVEKSSLLFTFTEKEIMNLNIKSNITLPTHIASLNRLINLIVENKREQLGIDYFHIDHDSENKAYTLSLVMESNYTEVNKFVFKKILKDSFSIQNMAEYTIYLKNFDKKLLSYLIEYNHNSLSLELISNKKDSPNKIKI